MSYFLENICKNCKCRTLSPDEYRWAVPEGHGVKPVFFFFKKDFYVIRCQTNQSIKQFANTTVDVLCGDIQGCSMVVFGQQLFYVSLGMFLHLSGESLLWP